MSNRKKKKKGKQGTRVFKAASHVSITKTLTFIPMRRLFFRILDIRKNKPPVFCQVLDNFHLLCTAKIYNLHVGNQKGRTTKQKDYKKNKKMMTTLCSSWIGTILQINQTSTITIVQTTVWFFGKKKKKEKKNNSHQKSKKKPWLQDLKTKRKESSRESSDDKKA